MAKYIDECVPATVQQINPIVHMYDDITDWSSVIPQPQKTDYHYVRKTKDEAYNLITYHCGFDTEFYTKIALKNKRTKFAGDYIKVVDTAYAYMYVWQMAINDHVIIGRTWEQFDDTINHIVDTLHLNSTRRLRIWIANLGCEFQFIRKRLKIATVFAKSNRDPVVVELQNGIILQDCLAISGGSLEQLANDFCATKKLKGDLKYTTPRNSATHLTDQELAYCINDVVILAEYDTYLHETYTKQGHEIPMTQTGIDRKAVQKRSHEYFTVRAGKKAYPDNKKIYEFIQCFPHTPQEYDLLTQKVYRGGYTHSNIAHTGMVLHNVNGWDYTSDYPAVMLQCPYPVTPFVKTNQTIDQLKGKAWYAQFHFTNLKSTTSHSIESVSKTVEHDVCRGNLTALQNNFGFVVDNGRVSEARVMTVWLTDLDWATYQQFYTWDNVEIRGVRVAEYGMLPSYVTDPIKTAYIDKMKIKNYLKSIGEDNSPAYAIAKARLNGFYGLCVQKIVLLDTVYNTDTNEWEDAETMRAMQTTTERQMRYYDAIGLYWDSDDDTMHIAIDEDGRKKYRFPKVSLLPQWGVWVCAHARRRLLDMVYAIGDDVVYCDTDSLYCINVHLHQWRIDQYNAAISDWNNKNLGPDFAELGTFDKLNKTNYTKFKTLGAKRYVKTGWNHKKCRMETHVTVAGLPKGSLEAYCERNNLDVYKIFDDGLLLNFEDTNKNSHKYNDDPHCDVIRDKDGKEVLMQEQSSLAIYQTTFGMSLADYYAQMIAANINLLRESVNYAC